MIEIENTTIYNTHVFIDILSMFSFVSLQLRGSTMYGSVLRSELRGLGFYGAFVDKCKFLNVPTAPHQGAWFDHVSVVRIRDVVFETGRGDCLYGCSIYATGSKQFQYQSDTTKKRIMRTLCPEENCSNLNGTFWLENVTFRGVLTDQAGNVVFCREMSLVMINCKFHVEMLEINKKRWFINYQTGHYLRAKNVLINATKMPGEGPLLLITRYSNRHITDLVIECPQSQGLFSQTSHYAEHFHCKYQCPVNTYTYQTAVAVLNGDGRLLSKTLSFERSTSHTDMTLHNQTNYTCFPCPVGATCEEHISTLPNYWGYQNNDDSVTMIRCPDEYCCQDVETCQHINACTENRHGTLCGVCIENFSEALFSAKCVPDNNCSSVSIIFMFILCVFLYSFLLISTRAFLPFMVWLSVKTNIKQRVRAMFRNKDNSNTTASIQTEPDVGVQQATDTKSDSSQGMNYLQILLYYVQDATLFKVAIPELQTEQETFLIRLLNFSPDVFATLYHNVTEMCFTFAPSAVSKVVLKSILDQ